MKIPSTLLISVGALAILCVAQLSARAHDASVAALRIDHPHAVPTAAGACPGTTNLPGIPNTGRRTVQPPEQHITVDSGMPQQQ